MDSKNINVVVRQELFNTFVLAITKLRLRYNLMVANGDYHWRVYSWDFVLKNSYHTIRTDTL